MTPAPPDGPRSNVSSARGVVRFVGAGPGDPQLLTLRALRCLQEADVIVHDSLVPPAVLDAASTLAERIPVVRGSGEGSHGIDPAAGADRQPLAAIDPGEATGRLLAKLAGGGRRVVRLKGGDPTVFARLAEELQPLREAGIPIEIVPGVTAAVAAAAAAGVPLTSRSDASSLTLTTGHRADAEGGCDFPSLARLPGTLVVYMGLERIDAWTKSLLAAGADPATPVVAVSRCGWPDEKMRATTLAGLRDDSQLRGWPSPAVIIVGRVASVAGREPASPGRLAGRRVLVTRPAGQAGLFAAALAAEGAECLHRPVMTIEPPPQPDLLEEAVRQAASFDWIVFSSVNAVAAFTDQLGQWGDARLLGTARLAAVGERTAAELAQRGLACDLLPQVQSSEGLLEAFASVPPGGRFLLLQADRGRETLQRQLAGRGHQVDRVAAYATRDVEALEPGEHEQLAKAGIDWIVFTSPAITAAAVRLFRDLLPGWRVACNSPASAERLAAEGLTATVVSAEPTMASLVEAIADWESRHGHEQGGRRAAQSG